MFFAQQQLGPDAVVVLISTEGVHDQASYEAIVNR
ncbi:hypothetical protein H4W33_005808 [Kibdelosporangium phytohabitans]|nr:hypothetical protein [Kibdelosporangium phytohabitans]